MFLVIIYNNIYFFREHQAYKMIQIYSEEIFSAIIILTFKGRSIAPYIQKQ